MRLGIRGNMLEKEPQKVSCYVQELKSPILDRMELNQTIWKFNQANNLTQKIENQLS